MNVHAIFLALAVVILGATAYLGYIVKNSDEFVNLPGDEKYRRPFFYGVWSEIFLENLVWGRRKPQLPETKRLVQLYQLFVGLSILAILLTSLWLNYGGK